jgi:hypothetical protein
MSSKSKSSKSFANVVAPAAPVISSLAFKAPEDAHENTDAAREQRRLTREEWRKLPPEEKAARKAAARAARPAPVARLTRNTLKIAKRVERVAAMFPAGSKTNTDLLGAVGLIRAASTDISELPADWRPTTASAARSARIEVGAICSIHEKYRAEWVDLLGADEIDGLRVVRLVKKNVLLQSESGTRITLPSNKLVISKG